MSDQTDSSTSSQENSQPGAEPPAPAAPGTGGIPPNIAASLAVLFFLIGGIVFLLIEKKSALVRFYAMQSIIMSLVFIVLDVVLMVFALMPIIGVLFVMTSWVLSLGCMALAVFTITKAYSGVEWEIPYIGKLARKFLKTSPI